MADGDSTRYQGSAYDGMREQWAIFSPIWVVPQKYNAFVPFRDERVFLFFKGEMSMGLIRWRSTLQEHLQTTHKKETYS